VDGERALIEEDVGQPGRSGSHDRPSAAQVQGTAAGSPSGDVEEKRVALVSTDPARLGSISLSYRLSRFWVFRGWVQLRPKTFRAAPDGRSRVSRRSCGAEPVLDRLKSARCPAWFPPPPPARLPPPLTPCLVNHHEISLKKQQKKNKQATKGNKKRTPLCPLPAPPPRPRPFRAGRVLPPISRIACVFLRLSFSPLLPRVLICDPRRFVSPRGVRRDIPLLIFCTFPT